MKNEIQAAMNRHRGMSEGAKEWVQSQTKDLQWYAFKRGDGKEGKDPIRGTLKELTERV